MIEKQSITDLSKLFVCPKCAHVYYGDKTRERALHLKCEFCDTEVLQTDLNAISPLGNTLLKEEEKIKIAEQYGKNQFSQDEYDKRIKAMKKISDEWWENREQQQKPKIKCPYCSSGNVTRISNIQRSLSTYLLGLGSSKIGRQWHCNDCNSDF